MRRAAGAAGPAYAAGVHWVPVTVDDAAEVRPFANLGALAHEKPRALVGATT